jgi:arsenite/tail-anchored protein-transporting ATPase
MRIILYTGKGGVGKTSVSAATAVRAAQRGYRTLVMSTDLAHSLADSLDMPLGPEPIQVAPNLWAQETDVYHNLRTHWGRIQEWLRSLLAWRKVDDIVADEVSVLPGMEELANLLWVNTHRESGNYDVIIVDCAPTGETLRLLSFPEIGRWWVEKIMPIQRTAVGMMRPIVRATTGMPMPTDDVYDTVQELFGQLDRLNKMLLDPELTSVRLVTNPEKMVIREAQRTWSYFNLFGYPSDMIVLNRIIPDSVADTYFADWKQTQSRHRAMVEERFAPVPIKELPLFRDEVVGLERLREMGDVLFGDEDPAQVYFRGRTQSVERTASGFILDLPLPFVQKGEVNLVRLGDELMVHVGQHRRSIILPRALVGLETRGASFEGESLRIRFERAS